MGSTMMGSMALTGPRRRAGVWQLPVAAGRPLCCPAPAQPQLSPSPWPSCAVQAHKVALQYDQAAKAEERTLDFAQGWEKPAAYKK